MSVTDALTITSAPDALTRYYDAKEREENAVLYINDAYLEVLNSLEKLEAENAKLRELLVGAYKNMDAWQLVIANSDQWGYGKGCLEQLYELRRAMRELGVEV